ncbi:uncharacterized protein LOC133121714 isoform X2 [Conger conger]|uniref:uncharacterized protein LOC133121714 isoform X2 n=1 Tax=Conger conger TaxID=82655 RepID=UPI002A5AB758|nr:uncharacterized protein LOC133121714 isoform X2 [Conger conger]
MGRRRTVSQGGVLHKLPILPPLPPLLAEHSELEEESVRLLHTPTSLALGQEGGAMEGVAQEGVVLEGRALESVIEGRALPGWPAEGGMGGREGEEDQEEGWEQVLQKVDLLWQDCEEQGWGPRGMGSLGPWPILPPPLGFGSPDSPPSPPGSAHGSLAGASPPLAGREAGSEHTRESESSGVQMSGPDQSGRSDTERREYDSDLGSAASLDREEEEGRKDAHMGGVWLEIRHSSPSPEEPRPDPVHEGGASEDIPAGGGRGREEEDETGEGKEIQNTTSDPQPPAEETQGVPMVTRAESPPSHTDSPPPLSPCKPEGRGSGLDSQDADAFVVTDSFVYLAVSALPTFPPAAPPQEKSPSPALLQPRPRAEEGDFLSSDGFVYLAAPERHTLAGSGSSGPNSQDSDSDAAQSGVDFAPGSTTADSDSDASKSEPDPTPPLWDQWEELEPGVLRGLFCDDQSESGLISEDQSKRSLICVGQSEQGLIYEDQSEESLICERQLVQGLISESQSEQDQICGDQLGQDLVCEDQLEQDLICEGQSEQGISGPGGPDVGGTPEQEEAELGLPVPCEEGVAETAGEPPSEVLPPPSGSGSERFLALDQARVPLALFWETHRKLEPWLQETQTLIGRLPSPAVDLETLRTQQDQIRVLKESVLGHQCHVDKLQLICPMLDPSSQEGAAMRRSCSNVEHRYLSIKDGVRGHSAALEEAISQSSQFYDKMEPLLGTLERAVQRLRQRPPVAVELEKIREQLAVHRAAGQELDKLLPAYNTLCSHGDDPAAHVPHAHPGDPASQVMRSRLQRLHSLWGEIRQRAQEREAKLLQVLDLAGRFWAESGALLGTLRDAQDITKKLEDPAVSPAHITQQLETTKAWQGEMGRLSEQLQGLRGLGEELIGACGDTEKPPITKSLAETEAALRSLNRMLEDRTHRLETAMATAVQYQDALQGMYGYLDKASMELRNMPAVGVELGSVQRQIQDLKQQRGVQKVQLQGELLVRSASAQSERDAVREPLAHLTHLWKSLGDEVSHRQHELEVALLSLGQLQQALMEAESWLSQSHVTLDAMRPISCDPKAIEMELANHQVLRDDVLSRRATMEALNRAASSMLLEPCPQEEASHLQPQLETVHHSWESLLLKTQGRQDLLEAALTQAEGFHGEVQECLQWIRDTERQLSATKPTGGLPETAREQLRQHMVLHPLAPTP